MKIQVPFLPVQRKITYVSEDRETETHITFGLFKLFSPYLSHAPRKVISLSLYWGIHEEPFGGGGAENAKSRRREGEERIRRMNGCNTAFFSDSDERS
jgi:hypothetical protein